MTAYELQPPIYRVRCDREGCTAEFEPLSTFNRSDPRSARHAARRAGWDVPPPRGKGSRSRLDFCPDCKTKRAAR